MTDREDLVGMATALVAVATLPLGVLSAVFLGAVPAAVVFVVGWFLLVPSIAIVGGTLYVGGEDETPDPAADDPVETLRDRYARGELTDEEFEARVERLLETEDVDVPAGTRAGPGGGDGRGEERDGERDPTVERG